VHLLALLRARKQNVESGLEVEGVRMEPLKKLIVPFENISSEALEECRGLVGEVVDWYSEPAIWEVEV